MTKHELNRDVKRLAKIAKDARELSNDEHYIMVDDTIKPELRRLYYADSNFEYCNKQSILILLRLNVLYRVVPLHLFGINIKL